MRPLLFIVALALAGCAAPTSSNDDPAAAPSESDFTSVPDCKGFDLKAMIARTHDASPDYQCQVSDGLSRSSQPDERWIRSLSDPAIRERPFHGVVNLRGENGANGEAPMVRDAGMTPLNIPVLDMHAPTRDQVVTFLTFVTDKATQPALVHCKAGQGRTGTFVAAYRMAVQGWTPADAIAEARAWNVNEVQIAFLQDFGAHLDDPDLQRFRAPPQR